MRLLSPEETQDSTEKRLNKATESSMSIIRRANQKLNFLKKYEGDVGEKKLQEIKKFTEFVKEYQARRSSMLKELKDLQDEIDRKRDLIDSLTEKQDELVEREIRVQGREVKVTEREKFASESEARAKDMWKRITENK